VQGSTARFFKQLREFAAHSRLSRFASHYQEHGPPKGEIVLLVGAPEKNIISDAEIDAALSEALKEQSVKQAAADIAARFDLPKRDMYQRALSLKDD
ncbi:MAG: 16S rRNA (cytidine(1402)-2'-O)-methyltransferase, partial [Pseudomonadota bacterium]